MCEMGIMLSIVSQSHLYEESKPVKFTEAENNGGCQGLGRGETGSSKSVGIKF